MDHPGTALNLNRLDITITIFYFAATLLVGFFVARKKKATSEEYFMGGRSLPWYVVATSMVATVIAAQYFVAQVGASYARGIVIGAFGWNAWIVYTLLIWIFLPYYMRTGLSTMPEFLERRYNPTSRYIFAGFLAVGYVASVIAGSLYAGGLILQNMFGLNILVAILFLGIVTGAYTIYGGLVSAAWTDFLQMAVLTAAGLMVPVLGLIKVGGLAHLVASVPLKFHLYQPPTDDLFPATGVFTSFLSIGIWYNCTSQHLVQRCLAAKNEWNARMGVVGAGFLHIVTPALFVLPGIIAYKLYPHLTRPDDAYLVLVQRLIPPGLRGLILAGMAAALMSTISSMINSTSTILTLDLYKKVWRKQASEEQQVRFGRWSGTVVLAAGILAAAYYTLMKGWFLFVIIQDVFAYIAPPFAVLFTLGILWKRANGKAAMATVLAGFPFSIILQAWLFPHIAWLRPYDCYLHRALISWAFCMVVMISVSLATAPPPRERTEGIIWRPRYALLPAAEQAQYSGWKDFRIWWILFISICLGIYAFLFWFQFLRH
jgi:solute:Na+ symporter, SSS family